MTEIQSKARTPRTWPTTTTTQIWTLDKPATDKLLVYGDALAIMILSTISHLQISNSESSRVVKSIAPARLPPHLECLRLQWHHMHSSMYLVSLKRPCGKVSGNQKFHSKFFKAEYCNLRLQSRRYQCGERKLSTKMRLSRILKYYGRRNHFKYILIFWVFFEIF